MGYPTPIEWTDATWNPVGGCDIHTPGCINCYAMRIAASGRLKNHPLYSGTTKIVKGTPVWNGMLSVAPDNAAVWSWPMGWRGAKAPKLGQGKPSMIFVGDMSDLFHQRREQQHIDRVLIAGLRSKHILQLLTKRADVMADYIKNFSFQRAIINCAESDISVVPMITRDSYDSLLRKFHLAEPTFGEPDCSAWPSRRLWLGFSAERQQEFDERWRAMRPLAEAGWQVFLSAEPLLGEIMLPASFLSAKRKPWVIAGGESGPAARPAHPDWFRSLRDQCRDFGLPFFFKQWGSWRPAPDCAGGPILFLFPDGSCGDFGAAGVAEMKCFGTKQSAGRKLDGVEHNGFPVEVSRGP